MKKTSIKIIISFFLAITVWSGVGFGVGKVEALTKTQYCTQAPNITSCGAEFDQLTTPPTRLYVQMHNLPVRLVESPSIITGLTYAEADAIYTACQAESTPLIDCVAAATAATKATPRTAEQQAIKGRNDIIDCSALDKASLAVVDQPRGTRINSPQWKAAKACHDQQVGVFASRAAADNATANAYDWLMGTAQAILNIYSTVFSGLFYIVAEIIALLIQWVIIPILGALVRLAAGALDMATTFTLDTANLTRANGAIVNTWVKVRDLFNITFIFILLYTAIRTIIGSASVNTKKMIANVIIAAILINFSLFITRIVIDAGNILAIGFYNAATANGTVSMSETISQALGISQLFNTNQLSCTVCTPFFVISAIQIIVLLTAFTVLLYAAGLFFVRIVALIFLMAISPIGFMGDVLPKIQEYSKTWRETLYGQVMVAPVFLLFFYLIVNIGTGLDESFKKDGNNMEFIFYFKFILICLLLGAAAKETKKMTGAIGGAIEGVVKAAVGIALGAVTGGAAFLGRRFIGAGAAAALNSNLGQKLQGSDNILARVGVKGLSATSKASFDARNTSGFKAATGFVGDQTGIKVDYNRGLKVKKGGFQGAVETREKAAEEYGKLITKNMPDVTDAEVAARRASADDNLNSTRAALANWSGRVASPMKDAEMKRLKDLEVTHLAEKLAMDALDDKAIKKKLEQKAKDERLAVSAEAESHGKINWIMGGDRAQRAAKKKVEKMKGAKTDSEEIIERMKKITAEEEAKKPAATPPPVTPAP